MITEEELIDELEQVTRAWALDKEPTGTTAEVTEMVEVDPAEWVTDTMGGAPDRAFVVNVLLDDAEVTEEANVEGEREVSAVYGYFGDSERFKFAYGADYPLIEPDDEEDEAFDDEEFADAEEE